MLLTSTLNLHFAVENLKDILSKFQILLDFKSLNVTAAAQPLIYLSLMKYHPFSVIFRLEVMGNKKLRSYFCTFCKITSLPVSYILLRKMKYSVAAQPADNVLLAS